jgi:hypothetical protein
MSRGVVGHEANNCDDDLPHRDLVAMENVHEC